MKHRYIAPAITIAQLDDADVVATSGTPHVANTSADDSAQLGAGRDGNPIWD